MKRTIACLTAVCLATLCVYGLGPRLPAEEPGPIFGFNSQEVPQLGQASEVPAVEQPSDAGEPVPPAGEDSGTVDEGTVDEGAPQSPRDQGLAHLEQSTDSLAQGQYDRAIREASQAIAVDPEHAAEYREVRAAAYLAIGRYEEAFSDKTPLEVTVVASSARLKSGSDVVGTVPRGTHVMVEQSDGNWLKVASIGEQTYDWAWVHKRDVRAGADVDETAPPPTAIGGNPRNYPGYVPPDPYYGGPGGDYGRAYYDWWQHVPPAYWRYLPR